MSWGVLEEVLLNSRNLYKYASLRGLCPWQSLQAGSNSQWQAHTSYQTADASLAVTGLIRRPPGNNAKGTYGTAFAYYRIVDVAFYGTGPVARPPVDKTGVGDTVQAGIVKAEDIADTGRFPGLPSFSDRPYHLALREQRRAPGRAGCGVACLAKAETDECGAPVVALIQTGIAEVFRHPPAIVMPGGFPDPHFGRVYPAQGAYIIRESQVAIPQNKEI
ncbi:hypothetical protein SAMN02927921_04087 [Sinomicrobium oceani]|uniref:Uncharacterized protein n=1 Tax=Sinomicrobium oceani TaxID=1150368 RepID=A0A1K1RWJ0_9FLAO|nr:hypothetical protein SAMN02927921_04087 [Sinomicrobium oceani]